MIHPWPKPSKVWSRSHIDVLGPMYGLKFFVVTDATSKWLEVFKMTRTTAADVINILRRLFPTFEHAITQTSPAKLMFGRNLRTKFDLLVPQTSEIAETNVLKSTVLNKQHRSSEFVVGDEVLAKDFSNSPWTSGTVIERDGNALYDVQAEENKILRRHADQLISIPKVGNRRSCPLDAFTTDFSERGAGESSGKVT
ncbi:hypothetical protein QE152_g33972 [Popillia japonica]|uniref:Integrase catalytic domain-containing protein n=1 Tax=Popillia japonica TaxID=7064 RepID=A0AAW1IVG8_POPJA